MPDQNAGDHRAEYRTRRKIVVKPPQRTGGMIMNETTGAVRFSLTIPEGWSGYWVGRNHGWYHVYSDTDRTLIAPGTPIPPGYRKGCKRNGRA